jgi:formamidopyrimidine-DNA glycosylase
VPELPDIEAARRLIDQHAGATVVEVRVVDPQLVRNAAASAMRTGMERQPLRGADRRGKWLRVLVGDGAVMLHLGMTGRLTWNAAAAPTASTRLEVTTTDGVVTMDDRRRLGSAWWCPEAADAWSVAPRLGPDALSVDRSTLGATLATSRAGLKATLIDQQRIAGLGNTLSDEVLWRAHLHPARAARSLTPNDVRRLHQAIRATLKMSVRAGEIPRRRTWLAGQRIADDPQCPRCGASLQSSAISGRTSWWCPVCQPIGTP